MSLLAAGPVPGVSWPMATWGVTALLGMATMTILLMLDHARPSTRGVLVVVTGTVATLWSATASWSARTIPVPHPTIPRRMVQCRTGGAVDWSSLCGQGYAERLQLALAPSLGVLVLLLGSIVVLLRVRRRRSGTDRPSPDSV